MITSPSTAPVVTGCTMESLELRRMLAAVSIAAEVSILPMPVDEAAPILEYPESILMNWENSQPIIASEGTVISGALANFSRVGAGTVFTAKIDWGDDVTTAGTIIPQSDGTFSVVGSHDYGVKGDFYVSVEISAPDGSYGYDFHQVLTGADELTLTIAPDVYAYTSSLPEEIYVASFFDREATDQSSYEVMINWGDGTSSVGRVVQAWDGSYDVVGDHAYSTAGDFATSVTIMRAGEQGVTLAASGTAQIWDETSYDWDEIYPIEEEVGFGEGWTAEWMGELCDASDELVLIDNAYGDMVVRPSGTSVDQVPELRAGSEAIPQQQAEAMALAPPVQSQVQQPQPGSISLDLFQADKKITVIDVSDSEVLS